MLHAPRIGIVRAIGRELLADRASVRPGAEARFGNGASASRNQVRVVFVRGEAEDHDVALVAVECFEGGGHGYAKRWGWAIGSWRRLGVGDGSITRLRENVVEAGVLYAKH